MKLLITTFFLILNYFAFSQGNGCYTSAKIDKLVKAIKTPTNTDLLENSGFERTIPKKIFETLDAKELIYYCTKYPESSTQICAEMPQNENFKKLIYPNWVYFPNYTYIISEKQKKALLSKETEILKLIDSCILKTGVLNNDYKFLIIEARLLKGINILIKDIEKNGFKNSSSCSALMDLMYSDDGYEKIFLKSKLYKLFHPKQDFENPITNNLANRNLVIEEAKKFITFKKI